MTTRNDVDVEFASSPRVAEVRAPSTEIIMQDLVDTLRKQEDTFRGMGFGKLINASGKEDLGGGVKVGITVAMQNLLLAFAGRTTPAETGVVTSTLPVTVAGTQRFEDTSADFVTAGVQRGSLLINFTDQSIADVVEVESATTLRTKDLIGGSVNDYTVVDDYKVWNIVQVNATGGNLVAVDDVQAVIDAILPTAFTQVVLTSSASATLQEQADVQFSSFGGGVTVDAVNGSTDAKLTYPLGTARMPVDNITDAMTIADDRGFSRIYIKGTYVFAASDVVDDYIFEGESATKTTLVLTDAATISNCVFRECTLTGNLDGGAGQTAFLDMGGGGTDVVIRDYQGGLELKNCTSPCDVSIDMSSGRVLLDATITDGDFTVRGVGKLVDSSSGSATVANEMLDGLQLHTLRKLMQNRMETDPVTGIMTIYDDDDTTVLLTGNIYEDVLAAQAYRGRGMERRDRLT